MHFCNRCGTYAAGKVEACPKCGADLEKYGHETMVGGSVNTSSYTSSYGSGAAYSSSAPAGHVARFVALIIDGILCGLLIVVCFVVGGLVGGTPGVLIMAVGVIVAIVYEPYFIASKGATPGKSSMGLMVVSQEGGSVSTGQSIGRFLLKSIFNQLFIPIFIPLFTEKRQGLHDLVVRTLVVKT